MSEIDIAIAILNRIYWKIPLGNLEPLELAEMLAAEATEALDYNGYVYHTILWDKEQEKFYYEVRD